ncbi:NADH dehydrogenase 1 alpha subcomplex assembly factor 3 [Lipomyces tetrasporus]|uniref:NADH dehydrogenase 1 alpha subcomplex assembly factor 3 n=1 Tax=Lipomyces tetrasporus TaxID=54092 RepID=A0AAD7QMF7_9ASCO|nr:NADH dehydrogenase 1 alpha subcomplex assembly factor 3 [Lipomyces tetrasporus]KAJ8097936.1 NADH dehydrogenase 1 alpha subcomplex assembly factor 3 [Lipomyces tetrasporus]
MASKQIPRRLFTSWLLRPSILKSLVYLSATKIPHRNLHLTNPVSKDKIINNATPINPSKGGPIQDFDLLQDLPRPPMAIDSVLEDGFLLSDGTVFQCKGSTLGLAVVDGQVFEWDFWPHCTGLDTGLVDITKDGLKMLSLLFPRPELLLVGLGGKSRILSEKTRVLLMGMGYTIEVTDTQNGANNFELLATERPRQVIALLLPPSI